MIAVNANDDERSKKFRETAVRRVRNVETTLHRVKTLSNPSSYRYTEQEVERIFDHLQSVLDLTRESFTRTTEQEKFSL